MKGYGVRERGSRFPVFTSERSRSPRARVAVSASGGQRHRGVRHEGLLAYGRRVAVSTSEGLFSASEGRGVCESRCPQRSRTSRAKGRGLHELGVARGSTLVERGSFDGLVRLVHVPKVEETRTILDFLWYGRVTDQRRVESTFDVRRSTFDVRSVKGVDSNRLLDVPCSRMPSSSPGPLHPAATIFDCRW